MKQQFAVGDKVMMSDEYLATLSASNRAELQGKTYTVESTREFHGTQMIDLSGGMSTSAGWLTK